MKRFKFSYSKSTDIMSNIVKLRNRSKSTMLCILSRYKVKIPKGKKHPPPTPPKKKPMLGGYSLTCSRPYNELVGDKPGI